MNLTVRYDPAADVLDITSGRNVVAATPLAAAALGDIAVETGSDDSRDTVGLIMLWASGYVAPYFQLRRGRRAVQGRKPGAYLLRPGNRHPDLGNYCR